MHTRSAAFAIVAIVLVATLHCDAESISPLHCENRHDLSGASGFALADTCISKENVRTAVSTTAESLPSFGQDDACLLQRQLKVAAYGLAESLSSIANSVNATPSSGVDPALPALGITPKACPVHHAIFPLLALSLGLVVTIAWLHQQRRDSNLAEVARCVGLVQQFCGMCNYSVVILESYQLCKELGMTASFSGQLIGIYMMTAAFGGSIMALLLKWYPSVWQYHPREVLLFAQLFNLVGFFIYSWVSTYVTYSAIDTIEEAHLLSAFLMVSRAMSGIGHGFCAQLLQVSFAHLTPLKDRPSQMVRFFFTNTLGIGLGPMIAATMRVLEFCPTRNYPSFMITGLSQLVLAIASVFAVAMYYPRLDDVVDFVEIESFEVKVVSASLEKTSMLQKIVVIGCMLNTFIRAFVTSGVEGATSLLLETEYGWDASAIGIMIGATFLCCFPAKVGIDFFKNRFTVFQWIQLLCSVSVFGSLFFFRQSWPFLILADILLFPSLYLSDGMVRGLMQQYALPRGSIFDQNHTTLWAMLLNSLGRYLGPWMARALLEKGDQTSYAILQVSLTLAFWVVFESMVVHPAHSDGMKLIETPELSPRPN